jgi:hypothetical protein
MKHLLFVVLATLLLSGCGAMKQPAAQVVPGPRNAPTAMRPPANAPARVDKVNLLLIEANRLAGKVQADELTRTQAADQLNVFRLRLVGDNRVDDSTFSTYRYLAVQRDAGAMTQEEALSRMEMKLRDWRRIWPQLTKRPVDPAFTNFLMRLYDMPPLGKAAP